MVGDGWIQKILNEKYLQNAYSVLTFPLEGIPAHVFGMFSVFDSIRPVPSIV